MTTTIIVLSVICAALALLCLYLLLYVYLTNKILETKDLMIMELQRPSHLRYNLPPWVDLQQMEEYLRKPIDKDVFFNKYPHLKSETPGK